MGKEGCEILDVNGKSKLNLDELDWNAKVSIVT